MMVKQIETPSVFLAQTTRASSNITVASVLNATASSNEVVSNASGQKDSETSVMAANATPPAQGMSSFQNNTRKPNVTATFKQKKGHGTHSTPINTAAGASTPFEWRANSTCSECFVSDFSRVLSFNAFRARMAKTPRREALFQQQGGKEDSILDAKKGTYWLVNSSTVQIQAHFDGNKSHPHIISLQSLGVSGSFVGGNMLKINDLGGKVTWNQQEILSAMPSEFSNEFVNARYSQHSEHVKFGKEGPGVEFSFSNGLFLLVNRYSRTLAIRIHMCEAHAGDGIQSGQCGYLGHAQPTRALNMIGNPRSKLLHKHTTFLAEKKKATLKTYRGKTVATP